VGFSRRFSAAGALTVRPSEAQRSQGAYLRLPERGADMAVTVPAFGDVGALALSWRRALRAPNESPRTISGWLARWRSRTMLSRYGASAAEQRARDAHRRLAIGDRL
jgi:hypothetical protein